MKRRFAALFAAILLLCTACAQEPVQKRAEYYVKIGETELTAMPRRVVTMSRALTETVCALGFAGRLVGVDGDANAPSLAERLPACGNALTPDTDAILSLSPDLVLTPARLPAHTADALEAAGCAVVVLPYADTLEGVLTNWDAVCMMLAGAERGTRMQEQLHHYAEAVLESLSEGVTQGESVLVLQRLPNVAATGGTWVDDLLRRTGLENAAAGGENWIYTPAEGEGYAADRILCDDEITIPMLEESVWKQSDAVLQDRVVGFDGNLLEAQTPRSLLAFAAALRGAYPEADFPEADIVLEQEPPEPVAEPEPGWIEKIRGKLGI